MSRPVPLHWQESNLRALVQECNSIRAVILKMGLKGAGGNYRQFEMFARRYNIDTSHFTGQGWSKGTIVDRTPKHTIEELLSQDSHTGTYRLKRRLFKLGLKQPSCEECGWARKSEDGRIPVELDHVNGDKYDNRIENLRILCPNCHSLKPTHRGRNIRTRRRGGGSGIHATLKTL